MSSLVVPLSNTTNVMKDPVQYVMRRVVKGNIRHFLLMLNLLTAVLRAVDGCHRCSVAAVSKAAVS